MASNNVHSHGPPTFEGQPATGTLRQAWYKENVDSIPDDERKLLETYSSIPPEQVIPHVVTLVSSLNAEQR